MVQQMIDSMQHEKFYVSGTYAIPELGVFAGWVALQESFANCQPIVSERGDVVLFMAGECFFDTGDLVGESKGTRLVRLYEERGDHFFGDLNGLFSGLLIDRRRGRAFLFNDRYGMERVYYHEARDGFFFASEAKALLRVLPELRAFDHNGLAQFLQYGCTLGSTTLFRDVAVLPAASVWSFDGPGCEKRRYFAHTTWESQAALTPDAFARELQATLTRVLPRYFESSADIGISLTGGLDTRMIMACRPATLPGLVAYTFAGLAGDTLDVRLASQVAAACGVPHHVLRIGRDFMSDFASLADRTVYITDGAFDVCGAHEIYLNNQARGLAPVRLTGNFGSEILRGVTTFKPLRLSASLVAQEFRQSVAEMDPLRNSATHPVALAAWREIPWHLAGVVKAAQSQVTWRTPYMDNDMVALSFRAPVGARTSSAPSLQVIRERDSVLAAIRTDQGLVPSCWWSSIPGFVWYRTSFKLDYWSGEGLPHWLSPIETRLSRLKLWPSGVHKYLRYARWFRGELAPFLNERLGDVALRQNPLWNRRFIDVLAKEHTTGQKNYLREINAVLTVDGIERLLLRVCP